jgi:hypothetical protein
MKTLKNLILGKYPWRNLREMNHILIYRINDRYKKCNLLSIKYIFEKYFSFLINIDFKVS